jgi:hypothetical protein
LAEEMSLRNQVLSLQLGLNFLSQGKGLEASVGQWLVKNCTTPAVESRNQLLDRPRPAAAARVILVAPSLCSRELWKYNNSRLCKELVIGIPLWRAAIQSLGAFCRGCD